MYSKMMLRPRLSIKSCFMNSLSSVAKRNMLTIHKNQLTAMNSKFSASIMPTKASIFMNLPKRGYFDFKDTKEDVDRQSQALDSIKSHQLNRSGCESLLASKFSPSKLLSVTKHITDPEKSIPFEERYNKIGKVLSLVHYGLINSKSVDQQLKECHYYILDYFCSEEGYAEVKENMSLKLAQDLFFKIEMLMINETFLYRRRQTLLSEEAMNRLDSDYLMQFIESYPELDAKLVVAPIIKNMQIRLRKFSRSSYTNKVIEWYFENVFGKKFSTEVCDSLNDYQLAQIVLNTSLMDYNLSKIEKHLFAMKESALKRIEKRYSDISTKELVQIISSIYRMNLVFIKSFEDIKIVENAILERVYGMNLIDIQSIMSGMGLVYHNHTYSRKVLDIVIKNLVNQRGPINSLILTNLMKSATHLRIPNEQFYEYIVDKIKSDYRKLDNVALAYSLARLVRLAQFDHAKELIQLYHDIGLFEKLENPHNNCQLILAFAAMKHYDERLWKTLIDSLEQTDYGRHRSTNNDEFTESARIAISLCKIEAPKLYKSLIKNSRLEKHVANYKLQKDMSVEISAWQSEVTNALEALGYNVQNEVDINGRSCDIYLPEHNLVIEYDGPIHFLNSTTTLIGSALYNERLLSKKAKVLHIPYYEMRKCKDLNLSSVYMGHTSKEIEENIKEYDSVKDYVAEKLKTVLAK